jgi:Ca2+-transporting ATPase
MFIDQFKSLPVGMLAVGAGLSALSGGLTDAVAIMAVVFINSVIGFVTEEEADRIISALNELVKPSALVIRDREALAIPSEEVVIGDLLVLRPGIYVAADARLVHASHLTIDESVLTGESMPVQKSVDPIKGSDIPLGDRVNMVYGGTLVTGGQGLAIVVAIGQLSEVGKIHALITEAHTPETPVEKQLDRVGNQLVLASSAICGVVFVMGLIRGAGFIDMLKTAVSLAVAAVPEGLPTVATTTLAIGVKNMRKQKVLFRNLDAVCALGAVQTVCLDKTGTLTMNSMRVSKLVCRDRVIEVESDPANAPDSHTQWEEFRKLLEISILCNESEIIADNGDLVLNGSPTENALIHAAIEYGVDVRDVRETYPKIDTKYRSDNRLYMTTLHAYKHKKRLMALKGSPVETLSKCDKRRLNGELAPLTEQDLDFIESVNEDLAGEGLRVLGVAYRQLDEGSKEEDENGFIWLGLVAMTDPVRQGVEKSIQSFHRAGVETVMITGDQSATAYSLGAALRLSNGKPLKILDSQALAGDPEIMKGLCKDVQVFARVSPSDKLQIVQTLQAAGKVVAMTGDGINDGPALKAADVGIAMGASGTDLARDVADVVLERDELETLIVALADGRTIYGNIRKALHFLLATNLSEILLMFAATSLGLAFPLNAMQLLWINLVSDIFPGLALAMEPRERDTLEQPPRNPEEPIVRREDYQRIAWEGSFITGASMASYLYGLAKYGPGESAQALAFQSLTFSQIIHAISCRSERPVLFPKQPMDSNRYLDIAIFGALGLQLLTQLVPGVRRLLGLGGITNKDWAWIGVTSALPLLISEFTKPTEPTSKGERNI